MKRAAIYSSAPRARDKGIVPDAAPAAGSPPAGGGSPPRRSRVRAFLQDRRLLYATGLVLLLSLVYYVGAQRQPREISQEDIDAAVLHTLENQTLPSKAAKAAETVRPSVVRVRGYVDDGNGGETEHGVASGVVIVDSGLILTNLHVVAGAKRVSVTFFDGLESEVELVGMRPESDLAVIKAKTVPDDLAAATLGSTQKLRPGDEVVAVGFPFGIGPSVSAGVISGLNREFRSP